MKDESGSQRTTHVTAVSLSRLRRGGVEKRRERENGFLRRESEEGGVDIVGGWGWGWGGVVI